jgi:uncharacterized pyridoxal phosphate-containing UPF0001 family protein
VFGENYVDEFAGKAQEFEGTEGLKWHFVGHI